MKGAPLIMELRRDIALRNRRINELERYDADNREELRMADERIKELEGWAASETCRAELLLRENEQLKIDLHTSQEAVADYIDDNERLRDRVGVLKTAMADAYEPGCECPTCTLFRSFTTIVEVGAAQEKDDG